MRQILLILQCLCTMPMYDTTGSLWQFRRNEIINNADVTNDNNARSFKYKAGIIGNTEDNGRKSNVKIVVPLKH